MRILEGKIDLINEENRLTSLRQQNKIEELEGLLAASESDMKKNLNVPAQVQL